MHLKMSSLKLVQVPYTLVNMDLENGLDPNKRQTISQINGDLYPSETWKVN